MNDLEIISALARRIEAQDKTIADALAEGVKLMHCVERQSQDIALLRHELNAHLHAPQMHGGPGGPRHDIIGRDFNGNPIQSKGL